MSKKTVYMIAAAVLVLSAIGELCGVHLHSPAWWPLPFGYLRLLAADYSGKNYHDAAAAA